MISRIAQAWLSLSLIIAAWLSIGVAALGDRVTVMGGDTTFYVVFFDTSYDDPFRVAFVDNSVWSVYRFDDGGRLSSLRVDYTKYTFTWSNSVEGEMPDMSSQDMRNGNRRLPSEQEEPAAYRGHGRFDGGMPQARPSSGDGVNRMLDGMQDEVDGAAVVAGFDRRQSFDCDDCEETLDTLCFTGLADVCFLADFLLSFFSEDGQASLLTMCTDFGEACETPAYELCEDTCVDGENIVFVWREVHIARSRLRWRALHGAD